MLNLDFNIDIEVSEIFHLKHVTPTNRMFNLLGLSDPVKGKERTYRVKVTRSGKCFVEYLKGHWTQTSATGLFHFFEVDTATREKIDSRAREESDILYDEDLLCTNPLTPLLPTGAPSNRANIYRNREKPFNVIIARTENDYYWGRIAFATQIFALPVDILKDYFDFRSAVDFSSFRGSGYW